MPAPSGQLERLRIEAHEAADCRDAAVGTFEAYVNPAEITLGWEMEYDSGQGSGSMTTFDLNGAGVSATSFAGAAFDGRYVYLVPSNTTSFVRFDAKEPKAMPPSYKGSFL